MFVGESRDGEVDQFACDKCILGGWSGVGVSTKSDGLGHDINLGNSNKYVLLVWLSELHVLEDDFTFFTQLL